ncbi:MAG: NfeD family protein [Gammaproteobacteria bacterium]|nr:NfeD family protein [Gammaproteobacteria bacterium]
MDNYIVWLLIGFCLMIVELLTGTFYLLVLGIAAFGGAAVAYLGQGFPIQVIATAVVASMGSYLVHVYRIRNAQQQMQSIDFAQPVKFEAWVDQGARIARVQYRDAPWEAKVEGDAQIEPGSSLYILATDRNTLTVTKTRPV